MQVLAGVKKDQERLILRKPSLLSSTILHISWGIISSFYMYSLKHEANPKRKHDYYWGCYCFSQQHCYPATTILLLYYQYNILINW